VEHRCRAIPRSRRARSAGHLIGGDAANVEENEKGHKMRNRRRKNRGGSMLEFALLTPVWMTLLLGTLWYGTAMIRALQVTQLARDFASMYSRSTDFSTSGGTGDPTAQDQILPKITRELGSLTGTTGNGVVIFSAITYVGLDVCALAATTVCTNYQSFVFTQRYTVGTANLRTSNFGHPDTGDVDSTKQYAIPVSKYIHNPADVVQGFNLIPSPDVNPGGYKSGQPIYIVEVFYHNPTQLGWGVTGNYAYAIF
jgi:Flp pilus assembly protein TadG